MVWKLITRVHDGAWDLVQETWRIQVNLGGCTRRSQGQLLEGQNSKFGPTQRSALMWELGKGY